MPLVLLVDPDVAVHELAPAAIGREASALGARTAAVAARIAAKRAPAVVVIDDQVADGTPDLVLSQIRSSSPQVRAVILTSSREPEHTARLATLGPVLAKPLDVER